MKKIPRNRSMPDVLNHRRAARFPANGELASAADGDGGRGRSLRSRVRDDQALED